MEESISSKAARTALWGLVEKFFNLGIQFLVTLILARLLTPDDYGKVAILTVFIAISNQVVECGFVNALIRKTDCDQKDYSTAFYINFCISLLLYILIFFGAPYIASFYGMPILIDILRVYAISFIFDGFRIVHNAILSRNLEFKKIARSSVISVIISGVLSIISAYQGFGIWALVIQVVSLSLCNLVLYALTTRWYPSLVFSLSSFKYLWNFGSKMLLTGLISSVYSNIYSLVIGKTYSSYSLGLFNRGQQFSLLYPNIIQSVFVRNSLPIMSGIQNDHDKLISVYHRFIALVSFLTFPIMFLICIIAKPIVLILLTDKWLGCVIYIQIFALNALLTPASFINLNLLQVCGRTNFTLKAEIIKKGVGFLVVFLLLPFGPLCLAIGSSLIGLLAFIINLYYARKVVDISYHSQINDFLPYLLASVASSIPAIICYVFIRNQYFQIALVSILFLTAYYLLTRYVVKSNFYKTILSIINKKKYGI